MSKVRPFRVTPVSPFHITKYFFYFVSIVDIFILFKTNISWNYLTNFNLMSRPSAESSNMIGHYGPIGVAAQGNIYLIGSWWRETITWYSISRENFCKSSCASCGKRDGGYIIVITL